MSDSEASIALPAEEPTTDRYGHGHGKHIDAERHVRARSVHGSSSAQAQPVDWSATVANCRKAVQARDTVISRAATGIGHWSQHIQAQTDANAGRISVDAMGKIFLRSRLLGPTTHSLSRCPRRSR